jgi:hypothetical protein
LRLCRALTKSYFFARFDSLSARIAGVDPATAEGRQQLMRLFDEHNAVNRLLNQSTLSDDVELHAADSRVLFQLFSAILAGMRAARGW